LVKESSGQLVKVQTDSEFSHLLCTYWKSEICLLQI